MWGLCSSFGDKCPDTGFGFALDLNVEASSEGNLLDSGDTFVIPALRSTSVVFVESRVSVTLPRGTWQVK